MGAQFDFLADVDDLAELMAVAKAAGASAITELVPLDDPPDVEDPQVLARKQPAKMLYLLPGDLAPVEVFSIEVPNRPGTGKVNVRTSPVVEVVPSRISDASLEVGRVYLALSPSDPRYGPAKDLYDRLRKTVQGWSAIADKTRVGPHAADRARSGGLTLVHHGKALTLRASSDRNNHKPPRPNATG